jgi:DNA modification methylase
MSPYYQDDAVTIYHGDCREILPGLPFLDMGVRRAVAGVLITDPPYGVNFGGKHTKESTPEQRPHASDRREGYRGRPDDDGLVGPAVVVECLKVVERGAVFPGVRNLMDYPKADDLGGIFNPAGAGFGSWGYICFHPVLFYGRAPLGNQRPSAVQSFDIAGHADHPCPKPLRWMSWLVEFATLEGETVLDPFAGSGTSLRAAKDLGRRAIGIEIEERYCEIAARRCAQEVLDFAVSALPVPEEPK